MSLSSLLIFFLYGGIALMEIPPLRNEKDKKNYILYSFLLGFSAVLSVLISMGIKMPSPSEPIKRIVISIFGE